VIAKIANAQELYGCSRADVAKKTDGYFSLWSSGKTEPGKELDDRRKNYQELVNSFYNLVTEFYEFGWGQSFHFGARRKNESFEASIARQEYYIALRLKLEEGMKVMDLGCGIGGPMRNIAAFSKAHVTGVNNNDFQVARANKLNELTSMTHLCIARKGDFMHLPFDSNSFDAGYQIEAFCHAPDKKAAYTEAFRVLKPGALFAGYQWCTTARYDAHNPTHKQLIFGIEKGNGVPVIEDFQTEINAIKAAGFELVLAVDRAEESEIPWYDSLSGHWTLTGFKHTPLGRYLTNWMVWSLEKAWVAPSGTVKVHTLLCQTANDLSNAGKLGIFTPMFLVIGRKPLNAN